MSAQINVAQLEYKVLNPLNDILMPTYGTKLYRGMEKEVRRIVTVLEKERLIHKRKGGERDVGQRLT
jgi:uncharacterized radical SAM superfamily protein